jgi:ATP-binding cassette subfamily B protein/subfamily B ATP-binding cassette protein MsbA
VSLIPRLYEPTVGRILIDGIDIVRVRLADLRRQIAIVQQDAPVMSGTVLDNLRYGRLDATRPEIEAAARAANADEFIERLDAGYETPLGEAGAGLSGGQRQRLSMARAFLKDAPILILDEPTAALDAISEEAVFTALRRLRAGRTTFVIAHRLSTIRDADRILVMDRGRVVDQGTHDTLLATSSLYRRLAARIAAAAAEADS